MDRELIQAFALTDSERATYPFLASYEARVDGFLVRASGRSSEDRFCLIGLIPTYRLLNHWGWPLNTTRLPEGTPKTHRDRVAVFRLRTGRDIRSTAEYLHVLGITRLVRCGPLANILLGKALAVFVQDPSPPWVGLNGREP